MAHVEGSDLSCEAKLARVVLANCGPLSPTEVATEAYITPGEAASGLAELERVGVAEPVCGVRDDQEELYALIDEPHRAEPSP